MTSKMARSAGTLTCSGYNDAGDEIQGDDAYVTLPLAVAIPANEDKGGKDCEGPHDIGAAFLAQDYQLHLIVDHAKIAVPSHVR